MTMTHRGTETQMPNGDVTRAYAELLAAQLALTAAAERVREAVAAEAGIGRSPVEIIAEVVARDAGLTREGLRVAKRTAGLALTRQVAMMLCRELTDATMGSIGAEFTRDAATVAWAVRQVRDRIAVYPAVAARIERLRQVCARALNNASEPTRPPT